MSPYGNPPDQPDGEGQKPAGQPGHVRIGGGLALARYLLNIVNAIPCYLGYLWPLWDSKRQTFADKIMGTYVIKATTPQPRAY